MKFCTVCGNILLPIRSKKKLYCKVCDIVIKIPNEVDDLIEYKVQKKKIQNDTNASKTIIIGENEPTNEITEEDRETYEDFFIFEFESDDG